MECEELFLCVPHIQMWWDFVGYHYTIHTHTWVVFIIFDIKKTQIYTNKNFIYTWNVFIFLLVVGLVLVVFLLFFLLNSLYPHLDCWLSITIVSTKHTNKRFYFNSKCCEIGSDHHSSEKVTWNQSLCENANQAKRKMAILRNKLSLSSLRSILEERW